MAIKIRDAAASAKKFTTNASAAQSTYGAAVANAGPSWAAATKAAADTYAQGVQQAIAQGRFANGVNQRSQDKFQTRASGVGPGRYGTGVTNAGDSWATGTQPYLNVLANLNLPARGVKGSPQNIQRVSAVADALRAKKLSGSAA